MEISEIFSAVCHYIKTEGYFAMTAVEQKELWENEPIPEDKTAILRQLRDCNKFNVKGPATLERIELLWMRLFRLDLTQAPRNGCMIAGPQIIKEDSND